jgi:quercetin dioxygenase-like cupin family protein
MKMRPMLLANLILILAPLVSAAHAQVPGGAPARPPEVPTLMRQALPDVPGRNLVVVRLKLPPAGGSSHPHRHPGSVFVYVTEGTARLGVEGQPVRIVHAGEGFFEPQGAVHTVGESASATEPASAIAVMIVPDGAALATPVEGHSSH